MHSLSASMTTSAIACITSKLKCAGLFYELLKKAGLPQGTQVQLRIYDINSQKWKWLGDWNDL